MKNFSSIDALLLFLFLLICHACTPPSVEKENANTTDIEAKVDALLAQMSPEEKVGQLALRGRSSREKGALPESLLERVRRGQIGAFLNVMDTSHMRALQRVAVEEGPHGIPLLFARDVIHGFKTIFPIPLGQAASWNPELVETGSRVAALEASSVGIRWTFAPMLDLCQDSRWGRIAESPGEDPYLASQLASAYIRGFQGSDLRQPTTMAACAKHFLAYGAAIGGRDYNTAVLSEELLYNLYLPPFRTAVDQGVSTVMTSFNEVNGVPATGNQKILTDILRDQLGFDGFVVSDWNSLTEMIAHGFARDAKRAAELAARAGLDMEMTSQAYDDFLLDLIAEGLVPESQLDFYVRNILRTKFRLGLFERPYVPADHPGTFYAPDHLEAAKTAVVESSVLLKNEGLLPLAPGTKVFLTGPLAHQGREQLGTWTFDGEGDRTRTPHDALPEATFVEGLSYSRDRDRGQFAQVLAAARRADVIVFVGGEEAILSGEAHSRGKLRLPGIQEDLLSELIQLDKPIALVLMAGRPINVSDYLSDLDALLMMWHPGTMGGPALREMLYGEAEPSGRLPVSWPRAAGQLPYFYNHKSTGRPANPEKFVGIEDIPVGAWQSSLGNESHYLDLGYTPLFPFGYGLSYGEVQYGPLEVSDTVLVEGQSLELRVTLTNTGARSTTEVVQLYARDRFGRVTRPVRELKRFQKVTLPPGERQTLRFTVTMDDFKYYDSEGQYGVESGTIDLFVGSDCTRAEGRSIDIR